MKRFIPLFISGLLMSTFMPAQVHASSDSSSSSSESSYCKRHKKKKMNIVGEFLGSIVVLPGTEGEFVGYCMLTFYGDGTFIISNSLGLDQPNLAFPEGAFGSLGQGLWKCKGKNRYEITMTDLINAKDCESDCIPANPFARTRWIAEVVFSDNDNASINNGFVSFYEPYDATLTQQIPMTPTLPFVAEFTRFHF